METNTLPGPHILSTCGTLSVPNAIAAIACAPPMPNSRSTPAASAAASVTGDGSGVQTTTSDTPATFAGIADISTVEGYAAEPPGTYRPTRSMATLRRP